MFDCQTSLCYFTVCLKSWENEWNRSELSSVSALSLNQKVAIKSAGQDSERSTPWKNTIRLPNTVKASSALSFLEISHCPLKKSCVKPVRNKISSGSISCAAYKYSLITLQWSWWDRCYICIPMACWSTYWWFTDCLHSSHSSVLWPFPIGSICQPESAVYIAEPLQHVEPMLLTLCFFRDCTQANK